MHDGGQERQTMPKVIIEKPQTAHEISVLTDEANTIQGRIRERAFELFEKSGEPRGSESENCIRAEEELLQIPQSKIGERDGSVFLHVQSQGTRQFSMQRIFGELGVFRLRGPLRDTAS
jgi:hypothetical protein